MNTLTFKQQKPADKVWTDEAGNTVPYDRTRKFERMNERALAAIAKQAMSLNKQLSEFKEQAFEQAREMYAAFIADNGGKVPGKGKGNMTFYNFDRSIKAEVNVNEQITFDENFITLAKAKLDELLSDGLDGAKDFVKPLVMDAFSTSRGSLDTKRVLSLKRYADRVKDPRYSEAMALIDKAIRKPNSREYFRVWIRDEKGQYQDIQLNFASI